MGARCCHRDQKAVCDGTRCHRTQLMPVIGHGANKYQIVCLTTKFSFERFPLRRTRHTLSYHGKWATNTRNSTNVWQRRVVLLLSNRTMRKCTRSTRASTLITDVSGRTWAGHWHRNFPEFISVYTQELALHHGERLFVTCGFWKMTCQNSGDSLITDAAWYRCNPANVQYLATGTSN